MFYSTYLSGKILWIKIVKVPWEYPDQVKIDYNYSLFHDKSPLLSTANSDP
jgi:hypothetical protein